jgi:predicted RNase H-like HicB family nuclease
MIQMSKHKMVVTCSEEDGAYIVDVPELPGCMADGKTRQEAVNNAEQVIKEWVDMAIEMGREASKPSALVELADAEIESVAFDDLTDEEKIAVIRGREEYARGECVEFNSAEEMAAFFGVETTR